MEEVYEATELSQLQNVENEIINFNDQSQNAVNETIERHHESIGKHQVEIDEIKDDFFTRTFLIEESKNGIQDLQLKISMLKSKIKETEKHREKVVERIEIVKRQIALKKGQINPGLPPSRIQKFSRFAADESHTGDQCVICIEDVEIGKT